MEYTVIRNVVFALVLIVVVRTPSLFAQVKIGYVNSAKILQEYPEAQEAQKKIDAKGKEWQAELEKMSKDLQMRYEEYQKKEAMLTEQAKRDQREELIALEQKGYQYRQEKFGTGGELDLLTDSLLTPIKKKVMKVIEQVAKEEKLQFVFDRNDQILVLLYGESSFDYTYKVIDKLKRSK
jgi:outer membrane protein